MLQNVLNRVAELQHFAASRSSNIWFRGHRRSDWQLKSTLHRHIDALVESMNLPEVRADLLKEEARAIYRRFKTDAWPLLGLGERSEWAIMFTMQHYSLPTRLLDWTESFLAALFFAHHDRQPTEDAVVWALIPDLLNEVSTGTRSLISIDNVDSPQHSRFDTSKWHPRWGNPTEEELLTIAAVPISTNPRMTSQRSMFTLMGDSFAPLDQQFNGRLLSDKILVRVDLPKESYSEVQQFLEVTGVRAYTFYPDLDGLAMAHEERIKRQLRQAKQLYPEHFKKQGPS